MFLIKFLLLLALSNFVNGGYIRYVQDPNVDADELTKIYSNNNKNGRNSDKLSLIVQPPASSSYLLYPRYKRELHGASTLNSNGGMHTSVISPLVETDHTRLDAVGSISGIASGKHGYTSAGGGLRFDTDQGHGGSLLYQHIPEFGERVTAAGKVNIIDSDNHMLDTHLFAARNIPSNPQAPNFNTYGGSLDYLYKDTIGGSLSAQHTPIFERTDYSALGKLNVYRDLDSSLDLNAGFSKSTSPFLDSKWEPTVGVGYTKYW